MAGHDSIWIRRVINSLPKRIRTPLRDLNRARMRWMHGNSQLDVAMLPALLNKTDPIILEIGANDGTHTNRFLQIFDGAQIFSFEPDCRAIEAWKTNVLSSRAKLFEMAIGAYDGTAVFHTSTLTSDFPGRTDWTDSGSLRKPKNHLNAYPWVGFGPTAEVEVQTLDSWFARQGIEMIDFIWADTQGAEVDLIKGGSETLQHTRFFYTEYNNNEMYEGQIGLEEIKRMIPGFSLIRRYPNDALFKNKSFR